MRQVRAVLAIRFGGLDEIAASATPERVLLTLRDLHERLATAISWHRGEIVARDGGGMTATLDAVDAMNAARAVLRRLTDLNRQRRLLRQTPLALALGLHHGPLTTGAVDGQLMALGGTLADAARLAALATQHDARLIASSAFVQAMRAGGADLGAAIADLAPMPGVAAGQLLFMLPQPGRDAAPRIAMAEAAERPTLH